MIRKYNYTGRQKITANRVKIQEQERNGSRSFHATLDLNGLGFPDDAKIYIEPYFSSSFLRFDFGTVARQAMPEDTDLSSLPATDFLHYRVKVVDESQAVGLILGFAVVQGFGANASGGQKPLLPVHYTDALGKRLWTLEVSEADGPRLMISNKVEGMPLYVKSDQVFFSLVYPEVVKQIAKQLASSVSSGSDEDELIGWQGDWMTFIREVLFVTDRPDSSDEADLDDWANNVADAFAGVKNVLTNFRKHLEKQ